MSETNRAWEPIGWGLKMFARSETKTAHVWVQSVANLAKAFSACGLPAIDQRELLPEAEASRRCTACSKTQAAKKLAAAIDA